MIQESHRLGMRNLQRHPSKPGISASRRSPFTFLELPLKYKRFLVDTRNARVSTPTQKSDTRSTGLDVL
jgi:hypothetical protein